MCWHNFNTKHAIELHNLYCKILLPNRRSPSFETIRSLNQIHLSNIDSNTDINLYTHTSREKYDYTYISERHEMKRLQWRPEGTWHSPLSCLDTAELSARPGLCSSNFVQEHQTWHDTAPGRRAAATLQVSHNNTKNNSKTNVTKWQRFTMTSDLMSDYLRCCPSQNSVSCRSFRRLFSYSSETQDAQECITTTRAQ